jgi:hypothetical protein
MGNSKRKWDETYDNELAGRCQDELMRAQAARRHSDGTQLQTRTEEAHALLYAAASGARRGVSHQVVVRSEVLPNIGAHVKQPVKTENFISEEEALALGKTELKTAWSRIYGRCVGLCGALTACRYVWKPTGNDG